MKTIIVWLRNDLRVHDHPALFEAVRGADRIIPLFIIDDNLTRGRNASANRTRFLRECLQDIRASLRSMGGDLVVRSGDAAEVLCEFATKYGANAVYYTADASPYARRRDAQVSSILSAKSIDVRAFEGRMIIDSPADVMTKNKTPYKVFTPFWRSWHQVSRRECFPRPTHISLPSGVMPGSIKDHMGDSGNQLLSNDVISGGENAARKRLMQFIEYSLDHYDTTNNDMAADATSRLSAYFHFGCISPREVESMLPDTPGAIAWHRQLCWRDFYYYILYHYPYNTKQEFQERYRQRLWVYDAQSIDAWKEGMTGYPVVDAAMRQLKQEGWMHNRARLIVGSFLTKDLLQDWRQGEIYFMNMLIDGDMAINNGNWQWIASVGVDPAPVFRRFYNPTSQQKKYDPSGEYVRRYVPELRNVPDAFLAEPWKMNTDEQRAAGCIIGTSYPAPIISHTEARGRALDWYRQPS